MGRLLEEAAGDYQRAVELAKERAELEEIVSAAREFHQVTKKIEEAETLTDVEDDELRQLAVMELDSLRPQAEELEKQLKGMLLPKDPRDDRNVIVEIRAGTGGDEAALFAAELSENAGRSRSCRRTKLALAA